MCRGFYTKCVNPWKTVGRSGAQRRHYTDTRGDDSRHIFSAVVGQFWTSALIKKWCKNQLFFWPWTKKMYIKLFLLFLVWGPITSEPLGRSRLKATHVENKGKFSLANLFVWPNTYYDIPKHRYPYYDENGTGRLLYGYGGSDLYRYSVFKPLEGYFRWKKTIKKSIGCCTRSPYSYFHNFCDITIIPEYTTVCVKLLCILESLGARALAPLGILP